MLELLAGDARELTAKLAYQLWEKRGRPFGSPEVDWLAAEKALASSGSMELPLYGVKFEADEGPYRPPLREG